MLNQKYTSHFKALGTNITLTVFEAHSQFIFELSQHLITYFENLFSIYLPNSEISQINQFAGVKPVQVSSSVIDLVDCAKKVSLENFGYNVAIGPLVKEWDIGFKTAHIPSSTQISHDLLLTDPTKIEIDLQKQTIFLTKKGMQLDLGGIAKGYIADRLKQLWNAYGIKHGIIDLGGNLLTLGQNLKHSDHLWRIGIQDPWKPRGNPFKSFVLPACSVVTSGIYERNFIENQQLYHHILDPHTGFPFQNNLMSVTVFTKTSLSGEIESSRHFFNPGISNNDPNFLGVFYIFKDHSYQLDWQNKFLH